MKKLLFILLASGTMFTLSSQDIFAKGTAQSPGAIEFSDALGRTVHLQAPPQRIVIAGKADFMLVDALYLFPGVGKRVVAVGATDQGLGDFLPVIDPEAKGKIHLGKSAGPEQILAANPDLILLKTSMRDSLGKPLEAAGVPVAYLGLETPTEYDRDLRIIGTFLGQKQRAEKLISLFDQRRDTLTAALKGVEKPRTLLLNVNGGAGRLSFSVPPKGWIEGYQVELAGGEPVWYDAAQSPGWNAVSFEQIAAWNPQVIILLSYRDRLSGLVDRLSADPLWRKLDAVSSGKVFVVPADFYSWGQPDPRWILGSEWIAAKLHPGSVPGLFSERVVSFFSQFYGLSRKEIEARILPLLAGSLK